jgi:hypothetical protein
MGIYPDTYYEKQPDGSLFVRVHTPGLDMITVYPPPVAMIENRETCFCCSCGDREGSDVACRNHGFAAVRPCEEHGMPGSPWDIEDDEPATMPVSVQEHRRQREQRERAYREVNG